MTANARALASLPIVAAVLVAVGMTPTGCRRREPSPPPPLPQEQAPPRALPPAAAMPPAAPAPLAAATDLPSPASLPAPGAKESGAAASSGAPLLQDERDSNPRSETVTIKILAEPRRQARVFWGRKDLGLAPLEIQRPRNSGPLDLLVLAPDCLPLHTRVFTDRDDKLWLRLYTKEEAPQVLGYRLEPPAQAPKAR